MKKFLLIYLFCLSGFAQNANILKVRQFREANESAIMTEYMQFLSLPNVSADAENVRKNANFIVEMMKKRGVSVELLEGKTSDTNPAVFGEVVVPNAKRTILFYAHYDGQPVNPKQWSEGLSPFKPVFITAPLEQGGKIFEVNLNEKLNPTWRISGRGSADDKAGVMTILNAYDALTKNGTKLTSNIKFFFEGEEEVGSTHLADIFEKHKSKLQGDCWVIADGPTHVSGKKMVVFGVRGDTHIELTVYASKRPLHSGNYGNWAPNPAKKLVELLASMKDEQGKVLVKGFYDDVVPLTTSEKMAIAKIPNIEKELREELGFAEAEGGGKSFMELLNLPTLNINGISSGNVGKMAANVIPTKAEAVLDLRLVKGNEVERQRQKVIDHIKAKGYFVTDKEPTDEERLRYINIVKINLAAGGSIAQRTPMDLPIAQNIIKAVQGTVKDEIVLNPSAGGTLPLFLFEKHLNAKVLTVPVVNYDNNQHAENENVKIQALWDGIETMAAIMIME
jgi:acetylornithine deacetylase/succinyl-diaminopimelate desuccinylase-like protein